MDEEKLLSMLRLSQGLNRAAEAMKEGFSVFICCVILLCLLFGFVFFFVASVIPQFKAATGSDAPFMKVVDKLGSMFMWMYLLLWCCDFVISLLDREHINYSFDFYSTKDLKYRDEFLICILSTIPAVVIACYHFITEGHSSTSGWEVTSFLLFLIWLTITFYHYVRLIWLLVYKKVTFVEAFLADQLCSLDHVLWIPFAVSLLPFILRAAQCLKSWVETRDKFHLINAGKYIFAMLEVGAKMMYEKYFDWVTVVYIIIACITTFYQLYWDIVRDWGLLQANSRNPYLRDNLMLRNKYLYTLAVVLDFVLRFTWPLAFLPHHSVNSKFISRLQASLEVIRRAIWNIFRLEYEHVRNAEEFSAV